MPTPNLDCLADEGMTFFCFYAQPNSTPGRVAMQTGRIPNRSGMTTVAFQGQGGGLPHAEWTLVIINDAVRERMKTSVKYPPRKLQSEVYTGPITLTRYRHLKYVRDMLEKEGVSIPLPTGN